MARPKEAVIARSASDEAIQTCYAVLWIASRSLAALRADPLARNDDAAHRITPHIRLSCPDLIRASINLRKSLAKRMDCRVKPGNDETMESRFPYCTLSATKRNSPSALDTSSRMDFLPSFFS